ncbi:MAG: chemotaxis protein CheW [Myxococcota bacterium]
MNQDLLLMRCGERLCALPVEHVGETMRPLSIQGLENVPNFVCGISIIRDQPTPIADLRRILGDSVLSPPTRLVTVRVAGRTVGLLVDEVLGVRSKAKFTLSALPPLLQHAAHDAIEALAQTDNALLSVLHAGSILPPQVWDNLPGASKKDE